jgi:hypothetical protein
MIENGIAPMVNPLSEDTSNSAAKYYAAMAAPL